MGNAFSTYHPAAAFTYLACAIVLAMAALHPVCAALSLAGAFACSCACRSVRASLASLAWALPLAAVVAVANLAFSATGSTELFRLGLRAFYLESFVYGACMGVMLISVIVGVTNIIPYFGPFIGAIPSILILLMVEPVTALWFALFVLLLQQLDGNVIGPKILGDSTGLSAFWVVFSITVFGSLLGLVGMFIGVPLFAVIYSLIRQFAEWRLEKKGLPISTGAFASKKHPLIEGKPPKKPKSKK